MPTTQRLSCLSNYVSPPSWHRQKTSTAYSTNPFTFNSSASANAFGHTSPFALADQA
ncbi:MAG: hypothetical protein OJF47_004088 [Nitrospira sp.]|jgi:hypothetical protein|nr:MAG: hypothetical protein OJF47_004088 [Nitrospira sp.]